MKKKHYNLKNWKSLDLWLKKNRIIDYIDRYVNDEIEINYKSNEDKVRVDKFMKLLEKKLIINLKII